LSATPDSVTAYIGVDKLPLWVQPRGTMQSAIELSNS
jgi:hypothetical protein